MQAETCGSLVQVAVGKEIGLGWEVRSFSRRIAGRGGVPVMVTVQKCQIPFTGLLATRLEVSQGVVGGAAHFVWGSHCLSMAELGPELRPPLTLPSSSVKAWSPGS